MRRPLILIGTFLYFSSSVECRATGSAEPYDNHDGSLYQKFYTKYIQPRYYRQNLRRRHRKHTRNQGQQPLDFPQKIGEDVFLRDDVAFSDVFDEHYETSSNVRDSVTESRQLKSYYKYNTENDRWSSQNKSPTDKNENELLQSKHNNPFLERDSIFKGENDQRQKKSQVNIVIEKRTSEKGQIKYSRLSKNEIDSFLTDSATTRHNENGSNLTKDDDDLRASNSTLYINRTMFPRHPVALDNRSGKDDRTDENSPVPVLPITKSKGRSREIPKKHDHQDHKSLVEPVLSLLNDAADPKNKSSSPGSHETFTTEGKTATKQNDENTFFSNQNTGKASMLLAFQGMNMTWGERVQYLAYLMRRNRGNLRQPLLSTNRTAERNAILNLTTKYSNIFQRKGQNEKSKKSSKSTPKSKQLSNKNNVEHVISKKDQDVNISTTPKEIQKRRNENPKYALKSKSKSESKTPQPRYKTKVNIVLSKNKNHQRVSFPKEERSLNSRADMMGELFEARKKEASTIDGESRYNASAKPADLGTDTLSSTNDKEGKSATTNGHANKTSEFLPFMVKAREHDNTDKQVDASTNDMITKLIQLRNSGAIKQKDYSLNKDADDDQDSDSRYYRFGSDSKIVRTSGATEKNEPSSGMKSDTSTSTVQNDSTQNNPTKEEYLTTLIVAKKKEAEINIQEARNKADRHSSDDIAESSKIEESNKSKESSNNIFARPQNGNYPNFPVPSSSTDLSGDKMSRAGSAGSQNEAPLSAPVEVKSSTGNPVVPAPITAPRDTAKADSFLNNLIQMIGTSDKTSSPIVAPIQTPSPPALDTDNSKSVFSVMDHTDPRLARKKETELNSPNTDNEEQEAISSSLLWMGSLFADKECRSSKGQQGFYLDKYSDYFRTDTNFDHRRLKSKKKSKKFSETKGKGKSKKKGKDGGQKGDKNNKDKMSSKSIGKGGKGNKGDKSKQSKYKDSDKGGKGKGKGMGCVPIPRRKPTTRPTTRPTIKPSAIVPTFIPVPLSPTTLPTMNVPTKRPVKSTNSPRLLPTMKPSLVEIPTRAPAVTYQPSPPIVPTPTVVTPSYAPSKRPVGTNIPTLTSQPVITPFPSILSDRPSNTPFKSISPTTLPNEPSIVPDRTTTPTINTPSVPITSTPSRTAGPFLSKAPTLISIRPSVVPNRTEMPSMNTPSKPLTSAPSISLAPTPLVTMETLTPTKSILPPQSTAPSIAPNTSEAPSSTFKPTQSVFSESPTQQPSGMESPSISLNPSVSSSNPSVTSSTPTVISITPFSVRPSKLQSNPPSSVPGGTLVPSTLTNPINSISPSTVLLPSTVPADTIIPLISVNPIPSVISNVPSSIPGDSLIPTAPVVSSNPSVSVTPVLTTAVPNGAPSIASIIPSTSEQPSSTESPSSSVIKSEIPSIVPIASLLPTSPSNQSNVPSNSRSPSLVPGTTNAPSVSVFSSFPSNIPGSTVFPSMSRSPTFITLSNSPVTSDSPSQLFRPDVTSQFPSVTPTIATVP